jgi:hypothetical protein
VKINNHPVTLTNRGDHICEVTVVLFTKVGYSQDLWPGNIQ